MFYLVIWTVAKQTIYLIENQWPATFLSSTEDQSHKLVVSNILSLHQPMRQNTLSKQKLYANW